MDHPQWNGTPSAMENLSFVEILEGVPVGYNEGLLQKINEIVLIITCLLAVCADGIIIYTVFHFERLKTVPNIFLVNWVIADALHMIALVITLFMTFVAYYEGVCVGATLSEDCVGIVIIFALLLSIDWVMAAYFSRNLQQFRMHYKYIVTSTWLLSIVGVAFDIGNCLNYHSIYYFFTIIVVIFTVLLTVTLSVIHIYNFIRKMDGTVREHPHLMLTLPTVLALCYIPTLIVDLLNILTNVSHSVWVAEYLAYLHPLNSMFNLFMLYYFSNHFHLCLTRILNWSSLNYRDGVTAFENDEHTAEDVQPVNETVTSSTQITEENLFFNNLEQNPDNSV